MEALIFFVWLVIVVHMSTSLKVFVAIFWHQSERKRLVNNQNHTQNFNDVFIFLPALREQAILPETIEHYSKISYPGEHLKVLILTTQKEEYEYELQKITKQTTNQLAKKLVEEKNKQLGYELFLVVHYPNEKGNKASQLNYGIDYIKNNFPNTDLSKSYIGIFDFDSRPEHIIVEMLNKQAQKHKYPDLLQPIPVFLNNVSCLSKHRKNLIIICHAMFQAVRSWGIEVWRLMTHSNLSFRPSPIYCMGASLFLKIDTLISLGGIPTVVDDIPLGFRYLIHKKRFDYLPSVVQGDLPEKTKQVFNQAILIQRGNIQAFEEVKKVKAQKHSAWGKFLVLWESVTVLSIKSFVPFVVLGYTIFLITTSSFTVLFWLIIAVSYIRFISGLAAQKFVKTGKMDFATTALAFIVSPIFPFCKTYGVWKNFQLIIKKKLTKKDIIYKKTER
jgi:hypothetical protein